MKTQENATAKTKSFICELTKFIIRTVEKDGQH